MSDDREALVRRRRWMRRVKAAAAIALALAAGTFLACASRLGPKPRTAGSTPPTRPGPQQPRDAGPAVDVGEHRQGMPVPDNLLE
jgi:hypothetical protein